MKKLWEIPLTIKINYSSSEFQEFGWPLVRVLFNDKVVANFEAESAVNANIEFTVVQDIDLKTNKLVVEHYGKNYYKDMKFFQVNKIYVNNIDLDKILWDGVQHRLLAPWEDNVESEVKGNMYLGHNGYILWEFENPILLDIQRRLGKTVKQISGQDSTYKVLNEVKEYFFNIE